jgi:hypothetical protein
MVRRLFAVFVVAGVAACGGKDPTNPGVAIGTFHVTANLTSSTCGAPPNPWEFDIRLNRDGSTLYWIQNGLPVAGEVDRSAHTTMDASGTTELRAANEAKKLAACEVMRKDALDVLLSNEDAEPAVDPADVRKFVGTLRYDFAPTDGSQCTDQLTASGGDYDALPCSVAYRVVGALKAERTE